jgi:drug/metabolite transporter (DMT)-like permease
MSDNRHDVRRAIYLSVLMVLLASTAVVAAKYASETASTAAIVTVQYAICMVFCLPTTLAPGLHNLRTRRLGLHLFRGSAGVLGFFLYYAVLEYIPLVDAMVLRQTAPLLVPLVMWIWQKDRVPSSAWLPIFIGFVGVVVILRPSPEGMSWWHAAGLASGVALAISMVGTYRLANTEPDSRILFYYFALSLVCVAPFSAGDYGTIRWQDWLAMIFIGVSIYYTLALYTRAYAIAPASAIAPITYLATVLGGVWGWMIWGQLPDRWSVLGSVLVIGGGLLTLYLARDREATAEPV